MLKIDVDRQSLNAVRQAITELGFDVRKEIPTAINKVARKVKLESARALNRAIPVSVSILKKAIKLKRLANKADNSAEITMMKGYPIPLKYFGASQTKNKGVTFRLARGTKKVSGAGMFIVAGRYKGHVLARSSKKRHPLVRQDGVAPGEVYDKAGVPAVAIKTAQERLPIELNERLRHLTLKAQGKLRGKQKQ